MAGFVSLSHFTDSPISEDGLGCIKYLDELYKHIPLTIFVDY